MGSDLLTFLSKAKNSRMKPGCTYGTRQCYLTNTIREGQRSSNGIHVVSAVRFAGSQINSGQLAVVIVKSSSSIDSVGDFGQKRFINNL